MRIRWTKVIIALFALFVVCFIGFFILAFIGEWSFVALQTLLSGWATYPFKILPKITYNFEMIFCGLSALALAMYFAHRFLRWFSEQANSLPSPWRFRNTACLSFLLLAMFGTSIAMTGIIHQAAWLASAEKITRTNGIWETGTQKAEGRYLLYYLFEKGSRSPGGYTVLPPALLIPRDDYQNDYQSIDALCSYRKGGPEPWLYPGAGRTIDGDNPFPVIVSPRPNREDRIIVAYSNLIVEEYTVDELPPEIAEFFE